MSAPPERLRLPADMIDVHPMADGVSYRGWVNDTMLVVRTDGSPSVVRVAAQMASAATSADDRWYVAEESQFGSSAVVARSLDGAGRRIVIAGYGRFAMVAWAAGGHEFVTADAQRMREARNVGQTVQGFYSLSYDAARPEPVGPPRLLFRAQVADFPGRNYAVGMAGNRFVFKQHVATPPPREIRVMANWHQRLRPIE